MRKITLTDKHQELLFQIPLFRDLPLNIKHSLLDRLDISLYSVDKKISLPPREHFARNYMYCWKGNYG